MHRRNERYKPTRPVPVLVGGGNPAGGPEGDQDGDAIEEETGASQSVNNNAVATEGMSNVSLLNLLPKPNSNANPTL